MNSAAKSYTMRFGAWMLGYTAAVLVSQSLLRAWPETAFRIPLAVSPVVPAFFAALEIMKFMGRMDELQRKIQFEALAFSFLVTGMATLSYGFLEGVGFPRISWTWVFPIMIALWGVGKVIAIRRYQ